MITASLTANAQEKSELTIQAGLVYSYGGPQPVARTKFLLFDKDIAEILKDIGCTTPRDDLVFQFAMIAAYGRSDLRGCKDEDIGPAITRHFKVALTTGFDGTGTFPAVENGIYYVFGWTNTRRAIAAWHLKVKLSQNGSIILDQNNALTAY
jgi:hypothetical protein